MHAEDHAYILQNADQRIVFVIPYEERFSLIGTTDIPVDDLRAPGDRADEIDYLLRARQRLSRAAARARRRRVDLQRRAAALRRRLEPIPSAVTRDYVLKLDADATARAPLLSIFGGKITTYRRLAEHALRRARAVLSAHEGGRGRATRAAARRRHAGGGLAACDAPSSRALSGAVRRAAARRCARRHGTRAPRVLGGAKRRRRSRRAFRRHGSTRARGRLPASQTNGRATAEDVLWRRTKCGLHMEPAQRERVARVRRRERSAAERRAMQPLATLPRRGAPAIRGVLTDIDDTLIDRRARHGAGVRARSNACAARASSSSRSPAGPPAGATTSRACGRSTRSSARTARSTCATTTQRASSTRRFVDDERDAAARPRSGSPAIGETILRAVPGCALASDQHYRETDLAIDYCEDVAAAAARGRRSHRRADARRGHDRQGQLDPRQRLVRQLRQADDDAHAAARRCSASISTPNATHSSSSAIRRTMHRCSRSSRIRSASPTCGGSPDRIATPPTYVTERGGRRGIRRARGAFCSDHP